MSEPEPFRIFVSYSRVDADLVVPVVRLLRATRGLVFLDEDNLRTGQPWRPQIEQAIQAAHLVAVFWCEHSNASQEVRQEYERAIARRQEVTPPLPDVMPVLLDSTPVSDTLGEFHGIDFRAVARRVHAEDGPPHSGAGGGDYFSGMKTRVVTRMAKGLQAELLRRSGGGPWHKFSAER
jgi:hypothetical protein